MDFETVATEVAKKVLTCIGKNRGIIAVSVLDDSCLQTKCWVINPDFPFADEEYLSTKVQGFNPTTYQTNLVCILSVLTAGLLNEIHCGCAEPKTDENPGATNLPCVYLHDFNTAVGIIVSGENFEWQEEILAKMKE